MACYPKTEKLSDETIAALTKEFKMFRANSFGQFKSTAHDIDNFMKFYMEDAVMFAPTGKHRGHAEIRAAFSGFESDGEVNVLRTWDDNIQICSKTRAVVLFANWEVGSMRGHMLFEDWYKQDDGTWKMLIDAFDSQ